MENTNNTAIFAGVKDGETFNVGEYEFIKFPDADGKTPVVMKNLTFNSVFGNNNDLKSSTVLKRLQQEILPKIVEVVGEENVLAFETDLTTLDGLKPYGTLESRISLPTMDFYRAHVDIFDKFNPGSWWWLATPESARPHYDPTWILCVSPSGHVLSSHYGGSYGVRPFLIFNSSIFESSKA